MTLRKINTDRRPSSSLDITTQFIGRRDTVSLPKLIFLESIFLMHLTFLRGLVLEIPRQNCTSVQGGGLVGLSCSSGMGGKGCLDLVFPSGLGFFRILFFFFGTRAQWVGTPDRGSPCRCSLARTDTRQRRAFQLKRTFQLKRPF